MTTYCGKTDGGMPGSQIVCADPAQGWAEQCKDCRIKDLESALSKMSADFEATVEHMNEGCIRGRAPAPKHPVDPRLLKKPKP